MKTRCGRLFHHGGQRHLLDLAYGCEVSSKRVASLFFSKAIGCVYRHLQVKMGEGMPNGLPASPRPFHCK
jgi:hypothetical protein